MSGFDEKYRADRQYDMGYATGFADATARTEAKYAPIVSAICEIEELMNKGIAEPTLYQGHAVRLTRILNAATAV